MKAILIWGMCCFGFAGITRCDEFSTTETLIAGIPNKVNISSADIAQINKILENSPFFKVDPKEIQDGHIYPVKLKVLFSEKGQPEKAFAVPENTNINISGGTLILTPIMKNVLVAGKVGNKNKDGSFTVNLEKIGQKSEYKVSMSGYAFIVLDNREVTTGAPPELLKSIKCNISPAGIEKMVFPDNKKYAIVMLTASIPINVAFHSGDIIDGEFFLIHAIDKKLNYPVVLPAATLADSNNEIAGVSVEAKLSPEEFAGNGNNIGKIKVKLLRDIPQHSKSK